LVVALCLRSVVGMVVGLDLGRFPGGFMIKTLVGYVWMLLNPSMVAFSIMGRVTEVATAVFF
jgi:hypothetical protein